MKLNDQQFEAVQRWLQDKLPDENTCPVCHAPLGQLSTHNLVVRGHELEAYTGEFEDEPPDEMALVTTTCTQCGHVMFFNLNYIGITDRIDDLNKSITLNILEAVHATAPSSLEYLANEIVGDAAEAGRHAAALAKRGYLSAITGTDYDGRPKVRGHINITNRGLRLMESLRNELRE